MKDNLINSIKAYSKKKTVVCVISFLVSIIGLLMFLICPIITILMEVTSTFFRISGAMMMLGIIAPIVVDLLLHKQRNALLDVDIETYINALADEYKFYDFEYYDLIDILRIIVKEKYYLPKVNQKNYEIINIFHKIIYENSSNGLANPFIYNMRDEFFKLCKFISDKMPINEDGDILANEIYSKYIELKSNNTNEVINKQNLFAKLPIYAKEALLIVCCVCYFFNSFNAWVFNGVAIILLAMDVLKRDK